MDRVDELLLQHLTENSRLSMRRLAELVHMTAPAVAERVRRLEEQGVIRRYTIAVDRQKIAPTQVAYVYVFMKSSQHGMFLDFCKGHKEVHECHRISGDACYLLRLEVADHEELNSFLDQLLVYGNYRLHTVISSLIKE